MKKQLLLLVMILLPMVASADSVEIDGIYYNLVSKGGSNIAEVTNEPNYDTNYYKGNIIIPKTVNYNDINYTITSIGNHAFYYCKGLESVTLPNGLTSIGDESFIGCTGISEINIPNTLINIGKGAFRDCTGFTSLIIPDNVTEIGLNAFYGCTSLTNIEISKNIETIEEGVFALCRSLTSISIPENITIINREAFWKCSSLKSFVIPNKVTKIGRNAFNGCTSLISIEIPNSVTSIDKNVFEGCSSLTDVHISSIADWCNIIFENYLSNPFSYADHLFLNNEEIKELIIPYGVPEIKENAFFGCSSLNSITIPNSVTSIGLWAFSGCRINSIIIPNSVIHIGDYTFRSCSNLKSIVIPNSVTSIGNYTYENCSVLASVTIGSGIKNIGYGAFASCAELADVYCYAINVPSTYSGAFNNSYINLATLHVPAESIDAYKAAEPWKDFKEIVALTDNDPKPDATGVDVVWKTEDNKAIIYDLNGVRLNEPKKGINIVNGKKYMIK